MHGLDAVTWPDSIRKTLRVLERQQMTSLRSKDRLGVRVLGTFFVWSFDEIVFKKHETLAAALTHRILEKMSEYLERDQNYQRVSVSSSGINLQSQFLKVTCQFVIFVFQLNNLFISDGNHCLEILNLLP